MPGESKSTAENVAKKRRSIRFGRKQPQPRVESEGVVETPEPVKSERVRYRRLWLVGLIAGLIAVIGNVGVYFWAGLREVELIVPAPGSAEMVSLSIGDVIVASFVPAVGAMALLAILGLPFLSRFLPRPSQLFLGISLFFLIFSYAGPLSLPLDLQGKIALCLMHTVAAVAIVFTLILFGIKRE